jgi:hypothetical protein
MMRQLVAAFGSFKLNAQNDAAKQHQQAAQQGAAPDRLQLRSSFLLTALPAAGELGVLSLRMAWLRARL